jgi:hypothetical protein
VRERAVAIGLLVLLGVAFVAGGWSRIDAPFGDSDEGINGAVWGAGSRALRTDGIVDSRFGGIRADGTRYATHPPLIVAETAVVEAVAGEHPWTTRAPAWLGALATIPLLFLLVRRVGLEDVPAAAVTVAALGCHLFLTYGSMLDTMVVALPFAVGLVLLWHQRWEASTRQGSDGDRAAGGTASPSASTAAGGSTDEPSGPGRASPPLWAVGAAAVFTALAGWQGLFLVGLCAAAWLFRLRSRRGDAVREMAPLVVGGAAALALTLGWSVWVHGGFDVLSDKLTRRSGEGTSLAGMVGFQLPWLGQLLGLGLLGLVACVVALRDRRLRPLAAVCLGSVVLYDLALREGAGGHQYWSYWAVLPAAVGLAVAARAAGRRYGTLAPLVLAVVVLVGNVVQPDRPAELIADGVAAYRLVDRTTLPQGQTDIPYVAEPYRIDDWLRYRGGPPGHPLFNADDLRTLAAAHPDVLVLVLGTCASPDPAGICDRLARPPSHPRFARADALVAQLS